MKNIVLLHGGVGSDIGKLDGINKKLNLFARESANKGSALDSVLHAVKLMEDDPDFNAGTGSKLRLDGSVQMDASVMLDGKFGSVAAIERVRNPILIARDVMEKSPHICLCSDGAIKFARALGYPEYDPITNESLDRHKAMVNQIRNHGNEAENFLKFEKFTNVDAFLDGVVDTVGAVARVDGEFAGAISTGGSTFMLRGRVGAVPMPGAGIYVGKKGAVLTTGIGEEIAKRVLCYRVYSRIGEKSLLDILDEEISYFNKNTAVGLIALSSDDYAHFANKGMGTGSCEF